MASTELPGGGSREATGLTREARLLLATAGGEQLDEVICQLASAPLDWGRLLAMATQERAEAIVAARMRRLGIHPPDQVQDALQALVVRSDLRMAMLERRLDETVAALTEAGIPVLLLKGAALGRTLYGSLPRRPMLDLDLLVPADCSPLAREIALTLGWVPGEMEGKAEFYQGHYHLPPLHDGLGRNFNLEIHSALFPKGHPFAWPIEEVWGRSRTLPGQAARVPAAEDLLLHVGLHFMWSHAGEFGPWRTFRDVRVMAEDPGLDWELFTHRVRASRGATAVYWTLRLARLLAGAPIPPSVEGALAPVLPNAARAMLDRHYSGQWFTADGSGCPSRRLARWLWRVGVQPHASGHGKVLPWDRELLFRPMGVFAPAGTGHKLMRHLRNPRRYLRYLRRVTMGDGR